MATSTLLDRVPASKTPARPATARRTIRVLHVINGEHYAGAERVQDLLAQRLGEFGVEVGFACIKPGQFVWSRQAQQAPIYLLPMANRFDLRPIRRLVQIVRREKYSLIHSHGIRTVALAAVVSVITGVPLVHHVHSPASRDTSHRWRNWANGLVERFCLAWAAALVAVSRSLARHVEQSGHDKAKIFVVPNGVPERQPVPARDPARKTWTLGTVALFRERKGTEVLLEALALVHKQGLPVRLRAVGCFETPQYQRHILRLAEKLGVAGLVDWTGFTQDVDGELAQMDLFVLPSLFGEGMPMVVLEAMASGVPVVASSVEGVPEAIRHGRDGLLVQPGDAADLAAAIARMVTGEIDVEALRHSALQRHAEELSDTSMAAGVAEVYRRVLA